MASASRSWTIIWLDANANNSEENQQAQTAFSKLSEYFKVFEKTVDCQNYIRAAPKKLIILIVSGRLSRDIVEENEKDNQISAIFLYCMKIDPHVEWSKQHPKVKGIHVSLDPLKAAIESHKCSVREEPVETASSSLSAMSISSGDHFLSSYKSAASGSLTDVTKGLLSIMPEIEHMAWTAAGNCPQGIDNLTMDECAALMLLTMDWTDKENTFQYFINQALSKKDKNHIKPWLPVIKLIFSACQKIPKSTKTIYRIFLGDQKSKYKKATIVESWDFAFCSPSRSQQEEEEEFSSSGPRTLLTIACKSSVDITKYAYDTSKPKFLLLPGRRLKVQSSLDAGNQLEIIQLEEVEPVFDI